MEVARVGIIKRHPIISVFIGLIVLSGLVRSISPANQMQTSGATVSKPANAQEDFNLVNAEFLKAIVPCQARYMAASRVLSAGDRYGAYDEVERAKPACLSAYMNADNQKFSEATAEPYRDKLNADLKGCSSAYAVVKSSLDSIGTVLNGDTRPSAVTEATSSIHSATTKVGSCMSAYAADAKASGVKLPGEQKKRRKLGPNKEVG